MNHPTQNAAAAQNAVAFIRKLTEMAYYLASRDIVVSSLHADWSYFGCWQLEVQRSIEVVRNGEAIMEVVQGRDPERDTGPEVVRISWDGRDGILSIDASPTRFLCGPIDWKPECSKEFDLKDDAALFQFVQDYLIKRLEVSG